MSPPDHETGGVCCAVPAGSRHLNGSFRAFSLNRVFAREVLGHRPARVLLRGFYGCVLDLARVARLLGVPVALQLESDDEVSGPLTPWLLDCVAAVDLLVGPATLPPELRVAAGAFQLGDGAVPITTLAWPRAAPARCREADVFDYAIYEFLQRDPPLLMRMQAPQAVLFDGCAHVLDLGCGAGLFLSLLAERGIAATGVERNPAIAAYGRAMGLAIEQGDALAYLDGANGFDGIFCSHFVEHLPFDAVDRLLLAVSRTLPVGGRAVFAFPDPESIRSQLLGFWRDPEHVRFYHPELIETVALAHGLALTWSSYEDRPHRVVPFPESPPAVPLPGASGTAPGAPAPRGTAARLRRRLSRAFGREDVTALRAELAAVHERLATQERALQVLRERTDTLWDVNQTWAWDDNAVLVFEKRG